MLFEEYRDRYLKDISGRTDDALCGRRIVLAISGSIAAVECPRLVRELMRHGADVHVCMSPAAARIVTADALRWSSGNPVITRLTGWVEHLYLSGEWEGAGHLVLVAPATANTVGKIAHGIDDTVVTTVVTTAIGAGRPLVVAPGMHACMARHPAFIDNLATLRGWGVTVVEPEVSEGKAKMAPVEDIVTAVVERLGPRDLVGRHVLITAGPTVEYLDPVRVITNLSSGKMGVALAQAAVERGARVTLIYGPATAVVPAGVTVHRVTTTSEMQAAVERVCTDDDPDLCVLAAAACDFEPAEMAPKKIPTRNGSWTVELRPTPKIIETARNKSRGVVVAFKAETAETDAVLLSLARQAMDCTRADFTVANRVGNGRGFMADDNEVYVLARDGSTAHVERAGKRVVARRILDIVASALRK